MYVVGDNKMNRLFFIIALFSLVFSINATLIETNLTDGAMTEVALGDYAPLMMNGTNTYISIYSNETTENTNVTISYLDSDYYMHNITIQVVNTTVFNTTQNYQYQVSNSTNDSTIFTFDYRKNNWTLTGTNHSTSNVCRTHSNIQKVQLAFGNYITDFSQTSASNFNNTDDGITATLSQAAGRNISITNATFIDVWYQDYPRQTIKYDRVYCSGASLLSDNSTTNYITTTNYVRSGTKLQATDIAYITDIGASSTTTGNITINTSADATYTVIPANSTTPTNNGGNVYCDKPDTCRLTNFLYSADELTKFAIKVRDKYNTTTDTFSAFVAKGTILQGLDFVTYEPGERLEFYSTPYVNVTNMSLYYTSG